MMSDASLPASNHVTPSVDVWAKALCRKFDPEAWFPKQRDLAGVRDAKEACGYCPLRLPCLEYGMGAEFGIFGGLDADERRALRRRRQRHALRVSTQPQQVA